MAGMMTRTERPLTSAERADLATRLAHARRERRLALAKTGAASALVGGVLASATLAASDAPWWVVIPFWLLLAAVFTAWIGLPWHRLVGHQVASLHDAVLASRAAVVDVHASRVIEFEEEEDEGACYAFDIGPNKTLFIVGQEFYEDDDFPNSDFAMIDLLGTHGRPVDTILRKTGAKLTPVRVVPAAVKHRLEIPEHLTVVAAPLEWIEGALGGTGAP